MQLTTMCEGGGGVVMLLTHRLCTMLISGLVNWLSTDCVPSGRDPAILCIY